MPKTEFLIAINAMPPAQILPVHNAEYAHDNHKITSDSSLVSGEYCPVRLLSSLENVELAEDNDGPLFLILPLARPLDFVFVECKVECPFANLEYRSAASRVPFSACSACSCLFSAPSSLIRWTLTKAIS